MKIVLRTAAVLRLAGRMPGAAIAYFDMKNSL
jgi:hypothetical protein